MYTRKRWYAPPGLLGWLVGSFLIVQPANAIYLDDAKTIQLSGVFYNQVRLRTEEPRGLNTKVGDWNLLQHRYFVDLQLQAEVLSWLPHLPFGAALAEALHIDGVRFFFNPRFEYDGVYDYGPRAFQQLPPHLRKGHRFQLFEVYGQVELFGGRLNLRGGRQNLSWGETDIFRLLDVINPLDNSFGGFLLPLDERRRPLTMLRATLGLGDFPEWGLYNSTLEAFIAPDKRLPAGAPGPTPWGVQGAPLSPQVAPTFFASLAAIKRPLAGVQLDRPNINLGRSRVGVRLLTTWQDITFGLAHLSTYEPQVPSLQLNRQGDPILKVRSPNIQVTGFTASGPVSAFRVPVLRDLTYTIFRTEIAGFFKEPFFIEDVNFALGKRLPKRDVIRAVIGIDHTQWIRFINPYNTFSFSAQQFYSNIQGSIKGIKVPLVATTHRGGSLDRFIGVGRESWVTTLIANSLFSASYFFNFAQLQPQVVYLYSWKGAWLFQPSLGFIRDPWRFRIEWNWLDGRFTDPVIGLLKDKDNLAFRIDYLL